MEPIISKDEGLGEGDMDCGDAADKPGGLFCMDKIKKQKNLK